MEYIRRQQVGLSTDIINLNMSKQTERQGSGEQRESSRSDSEERPRSDERRIAELKKKRKELEQSTEKTAEAVKKAADALRQAAREKSSGSTSQIKELSEEEQGAVIVESMPHLWVLPAEKVNAILEQQGVRFRVDPREWDNENVAERFLLLGKNGVTNTTKLPFTENEPKEIYKGNKVSVYEEPDGEYIVTGSLKNMEPDEISKILEKAGVDKKLSKPKGWDELSFQEKRDELRKQGVRVVPAIEGGALPPAGGETADVQNFDEAINNLRRLSTTGAYAPAHADHADWLAAQSMLDGVVANLRANSASGNNYYDVSKIADKVNGMNISAIASPAYAATLNRFLPDAVRRDVRAMPEAMDSRLRDEYDALPAETKRAIFGELDVAIDSSVKAMTSFGYKWDYQDQVRATGEQMSALYPDHARLIEWRLEKARTDTIRKQLESVTKASPTDWRDAQNNLTQLFRNVESLDFSIQELSAALQAGGAIVKEMPIESLSGEERERAEKAKREMNEQLDATLAMVQFFKAMEDNSMNPEKVSPVFEHFKDNTFKSYFDRFTKDEEGKDLVDPRTAHLPPEERKNLNLLDESMKVFMRKFNQERKEMNVVEELTKVKDITGTLGGDVMNSIARHLGKNGAGALTPAEITMIEEVRQALLAEAARLGKDWSPADQKDTTGNRRAVISEWYRTRKLLGAHGYAKRDVLEVGATPEEVAVLNNEMRGQQTIDLMLFRKALLRRELKTSLGGVGLAADKLDKMEATGLLNQVVNNAQKVALNFAWSDYDGVRVWDMNANKEGIGGSRGMVKAYVYNQETNMFFGRAIDHTFEFYVDEGRGKIPQTNLIYQRAMLGDRGNFLPQNRTMVRFVSKFAEIHGLKRFGTAVGNRSDFQRMMERKRDSLKNIDRLDMHDEYDPGWARSAAWAEMIDSGELSFEDANWSEMFGAGTKDEEDNITKYSMIDLYSDRAPHLKYTGGDVFQKYLQQPGTKLFLEINTLENFYSKREVRIKPWMKLAIPAHQEIGKYWKKWFKLPYNMSNSEVEHIIDTAVASNRLDANHEGKMKRDHLGTGILPGNILVRRAIQYFEFSRTVAKETGKRAWILPFVLFWALIKGTLGQSQAQLSGK